MRGRCPLLLLRLHRRQQRRRPLLRLLRQRRRPLLLLLSLGRGTQRGGRSRRITLRCRQWRLQSSNGRVCVRIGRNQTRVGHQGLQVVGTKVAF